MDNSRHLCIISKEKSESNLKLLEEAKRKFSSVFFVSIDGIGIGLTERFSISYRNTDLLKYKAVFPRIPGYFSSYAYQLLSLFPEDTYMPIKPISFLLADERFFLLTVLRKRGISTTDLHLTRSNEAASRIVENSEFPLIVRTPEKKTAVFVKNKTEARSIIDALASLKQPVIIEKPIKDLVSVYVAEPEVITSVKKKTKEKDLVFGKGDLKNQKIGLGIEQLAQDAARAVDSQIARVDLTLDPEPRVVNIDLNPPLIEPSKVTGVNIPEKIIESIHANHESHLQKPMLMKFFEDAKSVVKDVLKSKQLI